MTRALALVICLAATSGHALETQVLPKGAWMVDVSWLKSSIDKQWSGERRALSLIDDIPRYEPGGGLQGILRARPKADFDFLLVQLMYGITDRLAVGVYVPIVLNMVVTTNLSWEPGDYQSQLGRQYSEDDFWAWAASMGQPRVPAQWTGKTPSVADIVLGGKFLLPEFDWMKEHHFRWSTQLQVALPTGSNFDPEEAVSAGTNLWELHTAGDVEVHLAADKQFFVDENGIARFSLGADAFYALFRPRTYTAGHGKKNPLLNNIADFVGDTYIVDGGDWLAGTLSFDVVPIIGPTRASIVSGGDLEKANRLPPLLTLTAGFTHIETFQSDWRSNSPLWDWDREKFWKPGEKNMVRVVATVSFLRLGAPLQAYVSYRTQDLIPGRYTRPASVFSVGVRALLKFW